MTLSIITINYNNADGLSRTLLSIETQTCHKFEHIIIDGGSSDDSVRIIEKYEAYYSSIRAKERSDYPIVSWVSESDGGIYDAMNKGANKASGDYLYFLNSGDTLASSTVVNEMIDQLDGTDCIIGRVIKSRDGQVEGSSTLMCEKDMSMYQMYLHGINHQSALIRRDLLTRIPYDTSVKISADWKFFVQSIVLDGGSTKFVDLFFANYDLSGISSEIEVIRLERESILKTIIPERIARDYLAIAPFYYEVIRVEWLLRHPFWYKLYRALTTFGRTIVHYERKRET